MQTGNVTSNANFSMNVLDIQNGKAQQAETVNRQLQPQAAPQPEKQPSVSSSGLGRIIDVKA